MTFIPENKYREIIDYVPITCIDFFVIKNDKVLLWKRKNKPYKWERFVPWWRISKLETQQNVLQRKLKQETWIDLSKNNEIKPKLLWVYDSIFEWNAFDDKQVGHTINITYIIDLSRMEEININPDNQNETLEWFNIEISNNFCEYTNMLILEYINHFI